MSTDYQQLYLNDTATLAKTMVIKSTIAADLVNTFLSLSYGSGIIDPTDPTSWKYYLNLCGEYHAIDTVMTVVSLDNLEPIEFTKENLQVHTATAEAYGYGNRYYYALVNKYPSQEQLILGILYPADMDTAVNSPDGTILTYPKGLVEVQEITLISELQEWLYKYKIRWDVKAFNITDSLYSVAQHAIMYLHLMPKILNLRLKRCKTNEAHSFHIRSYLADHSNLDRYYDYMTLKQALFLYRNIEYIEHHNGKQTTFDWLMQKVLTDRRVPLADYSARLMDNFDGQYYPEYHFRKLPLNTEYNTPNKNFFTLENLLDKEAPLAVKNPDFITYNSSDMDSSFKTSPYSVLPTKDLESSMLDLTGDEIEPLTEVMMNHWGWLASHGMYKVAIYFKDPHTSEIQALFSDDAFIYWIYILMMGMGAPIEEVPDYISLSVQKLQFPTLADVMKVADNKYMGDQVIARWLINNQPRLSTCFSVSSFNALATKIFDAKQRQWYLAARTEHKYERALVENMGYQFYCDAPIQFEDRGQPFSTWLREKSLPLINYTPDECRELLANIFNAATGYKTDPTKIIANIQRAMLAIMSQLSSYSIQFIQEFNKLPIKPLGWAAIRIGDIKASGSDSLEAENGVYVLDTHGYGRSLIAVNNDLITFDNYTSRSKAIHGVDPTVKLDATSVMKIKFEVYNETSFVTASYPAYDPAISEKTPFIGYEYYLQLSPEQRAHTVDVYQSPVVKIKSVSDLTDIGDIIVYDTLNPMTYLSLSSNTIDIQQG